MKKQIALLLNLILLCGCLAVLFCWRSLWNPMGTGAAETGEIAAIKETHREAEVPFFTGLAFSGEQLPYDSTTSTFYLPLDRETEAWEGGELTSLDRNVGFSLRKRLPIRISRKLSGREKPSVSMR